MTEERIRELVVRLETTKSLEEETVWSELRPLGESVVPYLAEAYPKMRTSQGRRSCVFHSIRYARLSEAAFQLGLAALQDRATLVRYRACCLLAYSLRQDAIPHLSKLLQHNDPKTVADARAAIDAIKNQNHHYFMDRDHRGKTSWVVNPEDEKT
jgi:HEAT repeat protein